MFKRVVLLLLFLIPIGLIGYFLLPISQKDRHFYDELLKASTVQETEMLTYCQQSREDVHKEIWYVDKEPLNIYIESENSELFFFQQQNQFEVVEQLNHVKATMQEELYYVLPDGKEATMQENGKLLIRGSDPKNESSWVTSLCGLAPMQSVRYMEAEKACYNYSTNLFLAQNVILKKYKMQGHARVLSFEDENPLMSGKAQSVEFLIKGKNLEFQAHGMQAKFNPKDKNLL